MKANNRIITVLTGIAATLVILTNNRAQAPDAAVASAAPVVTQAVEKVQSVAAVKPARTYQVRSGDTLSRIAGSVYGDAGKWRKIYDANRDQMKNETDIKIGQSLVIPALGN